MMMITIGDVVRRTGVPDWKARRVCDEIFPDAVRVGIIRVLTEAQAAALTKQLLQWKREREAQTA